MAEYGGNKYGGGRFGGSKFGGSKFGGYKTKKEEAASKASESKPARKLYGIQAAASGKASKPSVDTFKGTVRSTGAGRTGEKGNMPVAPVKSAKMSAAAPAAKAVAKAGAWKTKVTPAKASKAPSYDDERRRLGDYYLAANPGMSDPLKRKK